MLYGEKIKKLRKSKGATQKQLADAVDVSRQTISAMENGSFNPSLQLCIKIAKFFNTSLDEVFWRGNIVNKLENLNEIFITDIGSTTTKGLYLKRNDDGHFEFVAESNKPTTVEKPDEDVKKGIISVAKDIEKSINKKLLTPNNSLRIPYITTSSAGGGLQIMAFGLTPSDTGEAVEYTAYGAGGVLLGKFTISMNRSDIDKMRLIRDLHPDLILMAGGMDGGNIAGVIRLAELLKLSEPTSKFKENEKPEFVYCGNKEAQKFVKETIGDEYNIHVVDNIRPDQTTLNTEAAKIKIHDLFMDNVMERAPGYSDLKNWVKTNIIPTPKGVENIISLYSYNNDKNIVAVDMGGATTDIFSNILGNINRTVSANIGMSFSISQIMKERTIKNIMKYFPESYGEHLVRNYISNKMLNPTYIPSNQTEKNIENSVAGEGINIAWEQHIDMSYSIHHLGFLQKKVNGLDVCPFEEVFSRKAGDPKEEFFHLSDIDLIIGAGGVLSENKSKMDLLKIMVEGFLPHGETTLAVDKSFKSPHMGVLAELDPDTATELYRENVLDYIGKVIAPLGKIKEGKPVLKILNQENKVESEIILNGGEIKLFKDGFKGYIIPQKNVYVGKKVNKFKVESDLPLLIDCRGRNKYFIDRKLNMYDLPEFKINENTDKLNVRKSTPLIERGEFVFERKLPYEGKILVKKGDKVDKNTLVGKNDFTPPRIFIIDLKRVVGYDNFEKLTGEDIKKGILVREGETVDFHQKIFKADLGLFGSKVSYTSPVRGKVIRIETNGMIILKEIQDYSRDPVRVEIAEPLGIKPKYIKGKLEVKKDDFVYRGQTVVKDIKNNKFIKAPTTGVVKEINTDYGYIVLQYDLEPVKLYSFINGIVEDVKKNRSVKIKTEATILYGIIGFGDENFGILEKIDSIEELNGTMRNKIIFTENPINYEYLEKAEEVGLNGLIAPSINNKDWFEYNNEELGVALTGDEDIPFTLVLTEGFGEIPMRKEYVKEIENFEGESVSISGRTQIRAGVERPKIIIN